ncbi:hypothetical protein Dimus_005484, partial [Dionaea muscipula]
HVFVVKDSALGVLAFARAGRQLDLCRGCDELQLARSLCSTCGIVVGIPPGCCSLEVRRDAAALECLCARCRSMHGSLSVARHRSAGAIACIYILALLCLRYESL